MTARQVNFLEDPAEFEHEQAATVIRSPKRSLFFVAIFGSLLLLLGGYIGYRALRAEAPQDPEAYDPITLEPKKPEGIFKRLGYVFFGPDTSLAGAKDDRVNILLLGMGGIGHEGPFLTDTIMIVSMKPTTNQIALISIPRDLGVEMPNHGWQKINQANSYGETEKTGWGGVGMGIGWLFMLLFWGLIIVAGVFLVRWLWDQGRPASRGEGGESALEILRRRYARGEIDREEFEAKKRDLVA